MDQSALDGKERLDRLQQTDPSLFQTPPGPKPLSSCLGKGFPIGHTVAVGVCEERIGASGKELVTVP